METFVCSICEKTFKNLRGLHQHERVMNHGYFASEAKETTTIPVGQPHKCDLCEKSFYAIDSLEYHQRTIHANSEPANSSPQTLPKIINCTLCNIEVYQSDIQSHIEEFHPFQPKPTIQHEKQIILHRVLIDLINRSEHGQKIYGTYLQAHNGRNALLDAYEEALDLCMYLRQALDEWEKK